MQRRDVILLWPRRLGEVLGLRVLTCLHEIGVRTHVIANGWEFLPTLSRYAYRWRLHPLARDLGDVDAYDAWLDAYCQRRGIDAVLPSDLETFRLLGSGRLRRNAHRLFPTSDVELLDRLHDKWRFYQLLQAEGLPAPRTVLIRSRRQAYRPMLAAVGFPMVAKPLALGGGEGIVTLATAHDARRYLQAAAFPLLLQERVPGLDAGLSLFARDGRVLAVMQQLHHPDRLEFFHDHRLVAIAEHFAAAVRFTGVAHIDLMTDPRDGGYKILECNPRFWASLNESMYHGVNFVAIGLSHLGAPYDAAAARPVAGSFYPAKEILRRTLTRAAPIGLSPANRHGFWTEVTDPLPFAFKNSEFLLRRYRSFRDRQRASPADTTPGSLALGS